MSIIFGPIPSRRLGRSLGINNIPPKHCSYSCVYCQVGRTDSLTIKRNEFFHPNVVFNEASEKINKLLKKGEHIDYLTFVPDGEPTLDINLGKTINKLKSFGIKIAVISNASLIYDKDVQNDLMNADWVSLKIDTVNKHTWRKINRPYGSLELDKILNGIKEFASIYKGELVTETMLVSGINDSVECLNKTGQFIRDIHPAKVYILAPTRPPAESYVKVPSEYRLNSAFQIFNTYIGNAELLVSEEGTEFTYLSETEKELLAITSVHPMRKEAVLKFIQNSNSDWSVIDGLISSNKLKLVEYAGTEFFIKNFGGNHA